MKVLIFIFTLCFLVGSVSSGACIVTCTHEGSGSTCPSGTECRSNGCGQTCQHVEAQKRKGCPPVLCKMLCEFGFAVGSDGCPICACAQSY